MSKGRVLVIDDDEWVCRLLAVAMKEAGFQITITENAADGFFRAVEEQPDVVDREVGRCAKEVLGGVPVARSAHGVQGVGERDGPAALHHRGGLGAALHRAQADLAQQDGRRELQPIAGQRQALAVDGGQRGRAQQRP